MKTKPNKSRIKPAAPTANGGFTPVPIDGSARCPELKIDLGCGPNKLAGFIGADAIAFPGVDVVTDLRKPWPWADGSVSEIHASHVIEHFEAEERVHIYNEMWRVMRTGAKATIRVPSWSSNRAYGDPTHKWPPVSGFSFFYLLKAWRATQAPHTDAASSPQGYRCDFDATWGFSVHPDIALRDQNAQQFALQFYIEAAQDIVATLVKRP